MFWKVVYSKQNIGGPARKKNKKDGPALSFTTKYYSPAEYHQ